MEFVSEDNWKSLALTIYIYNTSVKARLSFYLYTSFLLNTYHDDINYTPVKLISDNLSEIA